MAPLNEPEWVQCPVCGSDQDTRDIELGTLGTFRHFRCRYCGSVFHQHDKRRDQD